MSMNFGREQSLLRQRLGAAASAEVAAATSPGLAAGTTCLGAPPAAITAAANDLLANHPQMGRAQMTAFVRTLWQSKVHELRAVGIAVLAARVHLLEAADLPVVEKLLGDAGPHDAELLTTVIGPLAARHKKLWKDLERIVQAAAAGRRAAAVAACAPVVAAQADAFARFAKLVDTMLPSQDAELWRAVDAVLGAATTHAAAAAREFAQRHGRQLALPDPVQPVPTSPASAAPATPAPRAAAKPRSTTGTAATTGRAKRGTAAVVAPAPRSRSAGKTGTGKSPADNSRSPAKQPAKPTAGAEAKKPAAKKPAAKKATPRKPATKKLARRG